MDDPSRFCCPNCEGPDHGKRGAGNLTVTGRSGPEKARRMLRPRNRKARFSERKGTPSFGARLPPEKLVSVLEHVADGCGVRQTGLLCRVAPPCNTVESPGNAYLILEHVKKVIERTSDSGH